MFSGSNTVSRGAGALSVGVRGRLDLVVALSHRAELMLPAHVCRYGRAACLGGDGRSKALIRQVLPFGLATL